MLVWFLTWLTLTDGVAVMIRGVGATECVTCFERSCFGCALTAPPVGVCPVCGKDVRLDDFYEWRGYPVHWDCLDEMEKEAAL